MNVFVTNVKYKKQITEEVIVENDDGEEEIEEETKTVKRSGGAVVLAKSEDDVKKVIEGNTGIEVTDIEIVNSVEFSDAVKDQVILKQNI